MHTLGSVIHLGLTVTLLALLALEPANARDAQLLDAQQLISQIKESAAASAPSGSASAQLVAEIKRFRVTTADSPRQAAATWFQLYDRAARTQAGLSDLAAYDIDIQAFVGVRSVIAALPAPAAWPALRDG